MSNTPRGLTREDLATFLPNIRAIRAFEQLLQQTGETIPSELVVLGILIDEVLVNSISGLASSNQNSAIIESISRIVDQISQGSATQPRKLSDLADFTESLPSEGMFIAYDATSKIYRSSDSLSIVRTKANGSTALANALNSNLVITINSGFMTFTGGGVLAQLGGIVAALDGQRITILNNTGFAITILAENASSTAANRILTGGLASCTWNSSGSREFIYSTAQSRWLLIGSTAA